MTATLTKTRGALVISSGRCGSTVLSDVLAQHHDVLPLVEFFGPQHRTGSADKVFTAEQFWGLVTAPRRSLSLLLQLNRPPSTLRYDTSRLTGRKELSGLLGFTLPAIFDDPDAVHAELRDEVAEFAPQSLGAHYRQLFEQLARRAGKSVWIEKSATSALYADDLVRMFPDAPIVYLKRNLVDVALSMSHHSMFQLADITVEFVQRCGFDPYFNRSDAAAVAADVPADLRHLLPGRLTGVALDQRAGAVGTLCRMAAMQGMVARRTDDLLAALPAERVRTVNYEDLLTDGADQLEALGDFLGLDEHREWAARAAATLAPQPSRRAQVDDAIIAKMQAIFDERYHAAD